MHPAPRDFSLPEVEPQAQAPAAVTQAIRGRLRCEAGPAVTIRRRYLDTFDWSLFHAGAALEERIDGEGGAAPAGRHPGPRADIAAATRELRWLDLSRNGEVAARQVVEQAPGFLADLTKGPVRKRLVPVLGIRRLLPVAEVETHALTLRVLNDDDKTVARILLESNRLLTADGDGVALPARLRLLPVRGYGRELADTEARLGEVLHLAPVQALLFDEALAAAGRQPGDYSSKLDYRLDPDARADGATRQILLDLLRTLEANIDGTRANLDSEFLHDLRVATRRTRSALSQIKGVFPPAAVDDFKTRFAWLQQVTGPVRDLDVYLLDFPKLRGQLPERLRGALDPLRDWLTSHYDAEQAALAAALDSAELKALLRDWHAFLEAPSPAGDRPVPDAPNAGRPIQAVADERIWRMFKRVRREGRAITDASPPEALHELRKSCKKLRYLMEFFASLYPADEVRALIKQCKVLLDNLGGFQDLAVQADHLKDTAARMHAEGVAGVDAMLSMGALIDGMLKGQQQARRDFARIFDGFDTAENGERFAALFNKPKASKPVSAAAKTSATEPGDTETAP